MEVIKMKSIQELTSGDTTTATVHGTSRTAYALEPTIWLKEINDAAQKSWYFKQFAYETTVPKGTKDAIIPYRTMYLKTTRTGGSGGDWTMDAAEGAAVTYTKLTNLDGKQITPVAKNAGVCLSNFSLQTNAVDLIRAAKEELTYHIGERLDQDIAYALATATAASNTVRGAQTIYGGDARAESELATGDKITTDLVADAKTKLMTTTMKYWNPAAPAAEAVSALEKNPWQNVSGDPFVLFIAPEQANVFLKDSQFIDASEYGGNEIVMNGEVGRYLGIKIVVSDNVPTIITTAAWDGGGNAGAVGHRCIFCKPKAAYAVAWAIKPNLRVFDYESELEKRLVLEMAFAVGTVHNDAIVFIDVTDA
jgi:N4-gp56 family major capsid protein